jgi:Co/Zn/Cd efflux system component
MDCASEEQMIRMKLAPLENIASMRFDVPSRKLDVYHTGDYEQISEALGSLQLNSSLVKTEEANDFSTATDKGGERKLLWQVLAINFAFFAVEMLTGFVSNSMGLVADSLDMLADSLVYGLALFAVGGSLARKNNIAKTSGYFQLLLAAFGLAEVVRRFVGYEEVPAFQTMILISTLALVGNAASLYLLQKNKNKEAHMQASVIFTSNDVVINIGVIVAGTLVYLTNSKFPDLIIGLIIFVIVARGAFRILRLAK